MPDPTFLTTEQLSQKYALDDLHDNAAAWYRLLRRLRDTGKLREGVDWKFAPYPTYAYHETRVLTLICHSDALFCVAVRIEHRKAISAVLSVVSVSLVVPTVAT